MLTTPTGERIRYALLRPHPEEVATIALDLGGPGVSIFGAQWPSNLLTALPESLRRDNVLLLEEPWVTHPYDGSCRQDVREFFQRTRKGPDIPPGQAVARSCGLSGGTGGWGWTPAHYAGAISAVARHEGITVNSLVGASFAGRRIQYLQSTPLDWAVLINPAPLTMSATRFMQERRDAVYRRALVGCSSCAGVSAVMNTVAEAARALDALPVSVPDRSMPITGADVGPAMVALGYQSDDTVRLAWQALRDHTNPAIIGELADTSWARFGVDDLSPSWLAYLAEVCPSYDDWSAIDDRTVGDVVTRFLHAYHAPCRALTAAAPQPAQVTARRVCVVSSTADGVTPPAYAETWRALPTATLVAGGGQGHGDFAEVSRCLSAWATPAASAGPGSG